MKPIKPPFGPNAFTGVSASARRSVKEGFLTRLASKLPVWFFFLLLLSFYALQAQAQEIQDSYTTAGLPVPTVTSDKDDYAPGETAIITGSGWTLDEYVDIHLEEEPAHEHHHGYHDTKVNADGSWRIEYPIEERHLGVKFTVIVDGKQSAFQGVAYFTDAQPTYTNLTSNNNPSTQGETVTFTATVTRNTINGNSNVNGVLQFFIDDSPVEDQFDISNGSNTATIDIDVLTIGSHAIKAQFSGTNNNASNGFESSSRTIIQVVNTPPCTVPVLTLPTEDIEINSVDGSCGANVSYTATATGTTPTASYTFTGTTIGSGNGTGSGSFFNVGETTVTVTATNNCGTDIESFTVTVNDAQAPVLTVPDNITVNNDGDACGAVVTYRVSASDNCSSVTPGMTAGLASGELFPVGTTTVTYATADEAGNPASSSFTVTVNDAQAPVLTVPDNITVNNDGDACGA